MATLSINEAAKLFKKSRNTLDKMIKSGELSKSQDGKGIEFSELLRVFGEPSQSNPEQVRASESNTLESQSGRGESNLRATREHAPRAGESRSESSQKDIELAVLRERVAGLENLLAEREKLVLLLTHKADEVQPTTQPEQTAKPLKKSIWEILFYK